MTIARDGSPVGGTASGLTIPSASITAAAGSWIVAGVGSNSTGITSVTATGLTFTQAKLASFTSGFTFTAVYIAQCASSFSGVVTANCGSSAGGTILAQAYSGVVAVSPLDGAGGSSTGSTGASMTTTNANDVVIGIANTSTTDTAGAGWTLVKSQNFLTMEDQIVSATGTFQVTTTGGTSGSVVIALMAATGGGLVAAIPAPPFQSPLLPFALMRERLSGLLEPVRELWIPKRPRWV